MAVQANPEVSASPVDDRVMLLDATGQRLITLNALGAAIWRHLQEPTEPSELIVQVQRTFPDVAPDRVADDVHRFLDDLRAHELVQDVTT